MPLRMTKVTTMIGATQVSRSEGYRWRSSLLKTRRALGKADVPPTKLFRRLAVNKSIVKPRCAAAEYL